MKITLFILFLSMSCIQVCQIEGTDSKNADRLNSIQTTYLGEFPEVGSYHAKHIIESQCYYTGIGITPIEGRLFALAIDDFDMLQSSNIAQPLKKPPL